MATKRAGIGTGSILSVYQRPNLKEISEDQFKEKMDFYKGERLGPNTWVIRTAKSFLIRNTFITEVVFRQLGKYYMCSIPTDKKGNISQITMAERLLDTEDGDRHGSMRNVMIDVGIDALKVHKPADREHVYRWFVYPNETDVAKIDDSKTMIAEILGKGQKWGRVKCLIVGGTEDQRQQIAKDLTNNFTVKEKQIINNCLIEIVRDNRSFAGCFQGNTDANGNIEGTPKIAITTSHVKDSDVIIHEAIHALRQFDKSRDPRLKAVKRYWGRDADLEESLTDGETTGRQQPWSRGIKYSSGYYHYLKIPNLQRVNMKAVWDEQISETTKIAVMSHLKWPYGSYRQSWDGFSPYEQEQLTDILAKANLAKGAYKTAGELVTEDRVMITGDLAKGLKGKRAQKAILLKYPMTNISRLKIKGDAEAIDTFREVERSLPGRSGQGKLTTHIQMYKPDATAKTDQLQDRILAAETSGGILQWEDGQRKRIRKPLKSSSTVRPASQMKTRPKRSRPGKRVGPYFSKGGRLSRRTL